jgi:membrane-bound lytic murein transglycosylase F
MRIIYKTLFFVLALVFLQCKQTKSPEIQEREPSTLESVRQNGTLKVVTDYNSTSYFIYRGATNGLSIRTFAGIGRLPGC